tara:strand:- start:2181 stop:2603 length:423 start_codon:yes stop_codon:yes gene_type:complete
MLKLEKLTINHVQQIQTDFEFNQLHRDMICKSNLKGYVAIFDEQPVAIGGIHTLWDGVAEGWFVIGSLGKSYPLHLARVVKRMVNIIIEENNLFRLQASVCLNDKKAVRFIKWLKFQQEGIMSKFGPDKSDYYRYAWVRE